MNTTQQTNATSWLDEETKSFGTATNPTGERFPALKLQENKLTDITVDFSVPFNKWTDEKSKSTKALVPVTHEGQKKIWWINVKNPIYQNLIKAGKEGKTTFKILQTGSQANTRYTLVD